MIDFPTTTCSFFGFSISGGTESAALDIAEKPGKTRNKTYIIIDTLLLFANSFDSDRNMGIILPKV